MLWPFNFQFFSFFSFRSFLWTSQLDHIPRALFAQCLSLRWKASFEATEKGHQLDCTNTAKSSRKKTYPTSIRLDTKKSASSPYGLCTAGDRLASSIRSGAHYDRIIYRCVSWWRFVLRLTLSFNNVRMQFWLRTLFKTTTGEQVLPHHSRRPATFGFGKTLSGITVAFCPTHPTFEGAFSCILNSQCEFTCSTRFCYSSS